MARLQPHVLSISVLLMALVVSPLSAFAAEGVHVDDQGQAFLAISAPVAKTVQITPSDKDMVIAYINHQLNAYALTLTQYLSLDPDLQREVMTLPGRQTPLSREARRSMVPFGSSVPASVLSQASTQGALSPDVLAKYVVTLPASLEYPEYSLPAGYRRVLLGNLYLLIDEKGQIKDRIEL
jgi:hypothetical protein